MPTLNVEPQEFGRKSHERREAFRSARAINNLDGTVTTLVTDLEDLLDLINYASGTYTPTLTGITLGSGGTNTARYTHVAGLLTIDGVITLGTGFSIGDSTVTLPTGFEYEASETFNPVGRVVYYDVGTGRSHGILYQTSSTVATFQVMNAAGTYLVGAAAGSTAPFTWVAGDKIIWQIHARVTTTASFLLLEIGDQILLEDGTSFIELE